MQQVAAVRPHAGDGEGGEQSLERELVEAQARVTQLRVALGLSGASVTVT